MKSLRIKILVPIVVVSVALIIIMFNLMGYILNKQHQQFSELQMNELIELTKRNLINLYSSHDHHKSFDRALQNHNIFEKHIDLKIVAPDFNILYTKNLSELGKLFQMPTEYSKSELDTLLQLWSPKRDKSMAIVPILNGASCVSCHTNGDLIAYSVIDVHSMPPDKSTKRYLFILVGFTAFVVLLLIVTAFGVHFKYVKTSLRKIDSGIKELEKGNFSARIAIQPTNELGELASSINFLGERLERMRQKLKHHHETELERADKMATVGELAASIAHEIKNPVAGISNAMQVLRSDLPEGDERLLIFDEILRQTNRVNRAVNDLLTYARPLTPEFVVGNINDPTQRALVLMDGQIKEENVNLNVDLDKHASNVMLDPLQIQQVIVNLILNAIQAMHGGGTLTVTTTHDESTAYLVIADTGIGISQEKMVDIFKPFYTSKHKGTGLGLSISKSIVDNHNGEISVSSEVNKGTVFTVKLPIHRSKE